MQQIIYKKIKLPINLENKITEINVAANQP
jgi:hypothetical protein